jgi:GGDEF domain-containing protein
MPEMLSLFPAEGKKANEETFINESVLGHSFLNKAFKAAYQIGNDEFSVFISDAASPEAAKKIAETYIASTGISPVETADSKFMLMDGYNGTIFLAWKDKRIVIISGLAKDQAEIADRYTSEILK